MQILIDYALPEQNSKRNLENIFIALYKQNATKCV
jgi:hypothetical protein